jgi:hypothetical protein
MVSFRKFAASLLTGCGLLLQACDGGPTGPKTGSLTVNVSNLPAENSAAITVQGEVGTPPITVTATRTIADLDPGVYTITAAKSVGPKASYNPSLPTQTIAVEASTTPAVVNVPYTLATGIAAITITGLPAGTDAIATIFNGGGFFATVKASGEIGNLEPGGYVLQLDPVSADEVYAGTPVHTAFSVEASATPAAVQGLYKATTGSIQFSASGLPPGAVAVWDVAGPNNTTYQVRSDGPLTLSKLAPATYTVTARTFDFGNDTWGSQSPSQAIAVTAGAKTPAAFAYVTRPPSLNLTVEGAYITQSTQRFNGSVPLIANRGAFLRVFVKANEENLAKPKVRARFFRSGTLVHTATIDYTGTSVGKTINERSAFDTWGTALPAGLLTGGLSYIVDVDPDNTVRETNESDNTFPSSGTPIALDVRTVPVAEIRFVPIATTANSLVGNVSEARIPELMSLTLKMFPIGLSSADLGSTLTTNASPLLASPPTGNYNGDIWVQIINELNARRIAEGTQRHYVGILKTPYSSGIAGLGFVPGKTVLSWDFSGAASTVAHELGHNWNRQHAPCGGPANPDPTYPYSNGRIGVFGFDLVTGAIHDTEYRDVMSYCSPEWVSDYTYEAILNYRGSSPAASVSASLQPALMVWGRMNGSKLVLEPSFMTETRPVLPSRNGRYRVEGVDAAGAVVFSLAFDPERVSMDDSDGGQFGFAVPMSQATASRIVSIRLSGNGREVRSNATAAGAPAVSARSASADNVRLTWDNNRFPMLVVRDPDTKEILAFARGGDTSIRSRKRTLDVIASNRATSTRVTVQIPN